jgi:hypothetical protein
VRTDCRGFRICLCVIVVFIFENSFGGEDRLQEFTLYFTVSVVFICESSVRGEDRLQGM